MSIVTITTFVYTSWCLYTIARKRALGRPWLAWIPIAQFYTLCRLVGKGWGWFVMCLVPCLDAVILVILCVKLARVCQRSWVYGLLALVPFLNFPAWWILAQGSLVPPEMRPSAPPRF